MEKLNGLDLFSGIGGLSLALEPWVETVAYCERDEYAQSVLLSRMLSGDLDAAPIWDDVTTLKGSMLPRVDIITAGFPCQDISTMGTGTKLEGERSGLFSHVLRLTQECKPSFVFLENVSNGTTKEVRQRIASAFGELNYQTREIEISAFECGANHFRARWFCLAYSNSIDLRESAGRWDGPRGSLEKEPFNASWWTREPAISGVAHGLPFRLDRLKCLGNAVVPLQAQTAFKQLVGLR